MNQKDTSMCWQCCLIWCMSASKNQLLSNMNWIATDKLLSSARFRRKTAIWPIWLWRRITMRLWRLSTISKLHNRKMKKNWLLSNISWRLKDWKMVTVSNSGSWRRHLFCDRSKRTASKLDKKEKTSGFLWKNSDRKILSSFVSCPNCEKKNWEKASTRENSWFLSKRWARPGTNLTSNANKCDNK